MLSLRQVDIRYSVLDVRRSLLVLLLCLSSRAAAHAWTAYNDLGWTDGQRKEGITVYTKGEGGKLIDRETGQTLSATLAVAGGSGPNRKFGTNAVAGTDAAYVFNGVVDCVGCLAYSDEEVMLQIEGLDTQGRYEVVLYGDRGNRGYARGKKNARMTKVTLSGADAFANISSAAAKYSGPDDDSVITTNGFNNELGAVAWFTLIEPGTDGKITLTVADGGSKKPPKFYINAIRIRSVPEPAAVLTAGLGLALFALGRRRKPRAFRASQP